jgi:hypothetical protein
VQGLSREAGQNGRAGDPLAFFRNTDVGVITRLGDPTEPTAAVGGNVVWFTGNTSVALSTNAGRTFTVFDPSTVLPDDGMAFCCDQLVSYSAAYNIFVWVSQYWCRTVQSCEPTQSDGKPGCPSGTQSNGSNRIRIAVATPESLRKNAANPKFAWKWWDITPQLLGQPANAWFDRSDLGLNYWNANWTVDISCGDKKAVVGRIALADLARGGAVGLSWIFDSQAKTTIAQGENTSTSYYAATNSISQERIWSWELGAPLPLQHNVDHSSIPNLNYQIPGSSGGMPYGRYGGFPGSVESATVSETTLYVAHGTGRDLCTAQCDSSTPATKHVFDQPAVLIIRYDLNSWRVLGERWLWNPTLAFMWPALNTNAAGDVGIALRANASGHNAQPVAGFLTPEEQFTFAIPEGQLLHNTGDYYSLRRGRAPGAFVMTGQTYQNEANGPTIHWNYIEYGHGAAPYVAPPNVRIVSPANLATFAKGTTVSYLADVSDPVDGALPPGAIIWYEDGAPIGSGLTASHLESLIGTHTIQATATNGDGKSSSAQITIRVQTTPPAGAPSVAITAPADGQRFCWNEEDRGGHYHAIPFQATAIDPGGLPLTYQWTDSIDGGPPFQASTSLSPTLRLYQHGSQQETVHDLTLTASNGKTAASKPLRVYIMYPDYCIR